MKRDERKEEEIDLTKTLLFIFLTLILTLVMASSVIIPDIQQLKVSKIHSVRSLKTLKTTREYYDKISEENKNLQEKNRKVIEALLVSMKPERIKKFGEEKLGTFAINSTALVPYDQNFVRSELNVSSRFDSPVVFYDFIDSLNSYESLTEVTFPITILARDDYSLDVKFNMNVYELSSK